MKTGKKILLFPQRLLQVVALAVFLSAASLGSANAQASATDSLALVAIYNSTNGASWTSSANWLTGPVSTWEGVTVTGTRVTALSLPFHNLTGTLPFQTGLLSKLTSLELTGNAIGGNIPSSLVLLTRLEALNLSENQITGSIPAVLGFNLRLRSLTLSKNQLSGSIPPTFLLLQQLTFLDLSENDLTGEIPAGLGLLPELERLYLNNNQLTGSIPFTVGYLRNSIEIFLDGNQLTGAIPSAIGDLDSLIRFTAANNDLTGDVPATVTSMAQLFQLNVAGNELSGLPNLSGMATLFQLRVGDNRLTFEDIEPNKPKMPSPSAYAPQDSVGVADAITLCAGDTLTISADFTGSVPNNRYRWFKTPNVAVTAIVADPVLTIPNVDPSHSGTYFARCTNTVATGLTIVRRPVTVTVNTCATDFARVANEEVRVFPNTFTQETTVYVGAEQDEDLSLVIMNKEGQVVEILKGLKTNQELKIGERLRGGLYYLQAIHGDKKEVTRIIKR